MKTKICSAVLALSFFFAAAGCRSRVPENDAAVEAGAPGECLVMPGHMASTEFFADHEGNRYYFCCAWCIDEFLSEPDKYLFGEAGAVEHHAH